MKIPNKRKFQQIAINYSSDTEFKDFLKLYKIVLKKDILFQSTIHFSQQIIPYILGTI